MIPFQLRDLPMKEFRRSLIDYEKPWRVDVNGKRHYTDGTVIVPSVTSVLSTVDAGKFDWWYEAIGVDAANQIVRRSQNRGQQIHKMAENYILGRPLTTPDEEVKIFNSEAIQMYRGIHRIITETVDDILLVEGMLLSRKIGVAGTVDLCASWNGVPAIIDFKNARRGKTEEELLSYFIQETFYQLMVEEMFGIHIEKIVTVSTVEGSGVVVTERDPRDYYDSVYETMAKYNKMVGK